MRASILARSRPYPTEPRKHERTCQRCGITYTTRPGKRDQHITRCRDCRGT